MSDILPTVRIVRNGKVVIINESDFDPEVHKLADEKKPSESKPTAGTSGAASEKAKPTGAKTTKSTQSQTAKK